MRTVAHFAQQRRTDQEPSVPSEEQLLERRAELEVIAQSLLSPRSSAPPAGEVPLPRTLASLPPEKDVAATCIQRTWRGERAREEARRRLSEQWAEDYPRLRQSLKRSEGARENISELRREVAAMRLTVEQRRQALHRVESMCLEVRSQLQAVANVARRRRSPNRAV